MQTVGGPAASSGQEGPKLAVVLLELTCLVMLLAKMEKAHEAEMLRDRLVNEGFGSNGHMNRYGKQPPNKWVP
jgi:hypothetical protein